MSNQTAIIRDVTLNWAHLVDPVNPFGADQWDIQLTTEDEDKAKVFSSLGLKVKENGGVYSVNLKRKAVNAKGAPNDPPEVVDGDQNKMDSSIVRKLGNGSKGNVKVFTYEYNHAGRSGTGAILVGVQVTEFIEYENEGASW